MQEIRKKPSRRYHRKSNNREQKQMDKLLVKVDDIRAGRIHAIAEVKARLRELLSPENTVYLTGDTHGNFDRILDFCSQLEVQGGSTLIILGDVGLNYHGGQGDLWRKKMLRDITTTFFCIHGNHEMRCDRLPSLATSDPFITEVRYGLNRSSPTSSLPLMVKSITSWAIPV